jgi:hypothetical protein
MAYAVRIVKTTGSADDPQVQEDFINAVESKLNIRTNATLVEVKFQRNLYYQNVDTVADAKAMPDMPKRKLLADYIAFIVTG